MCLGGAAVLSPADVEEAFRKAGGRRARLHAFSAEKTAGRLCGDLRRFLSALARGDVSAAAQ